MKIPPNLEHWSTALAGEGYEISDRIIVLERPVTDPLDGTEFLVYIQTDQGTMRLDSQVLTKIAQGEPIVIAHLLEELGGSVKRILSRP